MISPTIFFNLILGVIGALKVFTHRLRRHQGRPGLRDLVLHAAHLHRAPSSTSSMGYASALAWIFFVIVLA